jgi:hypothetical protein
MGGAGRLRSRAETRRQGVSRRIGVLLGLGKPSGMGLGLTTTVYLIAPRGRRPPIPHRSSCRKCETGSTRT